MIGVIQVSVEVTQLTDNCGSAGLILRVLRNSIGMTSRSSASLVDASRARASACVFYSLGTCQILKELNALNKSLAFCKSAAIFSPHA